ncbi:MAG: hypothetical protein FKY71_18685 [Spiribacter salinus]|uniref:Uncharacterized protein n=1 Tax=Spiribacter salinus TaxID=1335746 RepID=A0A540V835_9GAMM|nr:MAG: hypothetical protein FKY71_18685 [Spiribacter salinus]
MTKINAQAVKPITSALMDLCESYDGKKARELNSGLTLEDVWNLSFEDAVRKMDEHDALD